LDKDGLMNLSAKDIFALAVETVEKSALPRDLLKEFSEASVATQTMKPVELVRYYAGSRLPPPLVGAFIDASLTMQTLPRLEYVAIETARANLQNASYRGPIITV
ncbi:MAG TPA: hypothetical protein VL625_12370, partial [Patescibacteria group bacterium]|nr:hypothetical protein [Patescibacteria group bacterium]